MVYGHYKHFNSFSTENRLETSESDIYRHQILMSKVDPRTVRIKAPVTNPIDIMVELSGIYRYINRVSQISHATANTVKGGK